MSAVMHEVLPQEIQQLLNSSEGAAFEQALDVLVRQREQKLFRSLGLLARDLHDAVRRLGGELAQEGVPGSVADARQHLDEALTMSAQAAHRMLDFVDRVRPMAESLEAKAAGVLAHASRSEQEMSLAGEATKFTATVTEGLVTLVTDQSWQDLAGQRIKKVGNFISSVESSLLELVALTGELASRAPTDEPVKVTSQEEADRLLSEFGF